MRADDGRAISNFVNQALRREPITIYGEGNQTRCFCFVDDLVEGLVRAAAKLHPAPINLGSDIEISIRQAAEKVVAMAGHGSLTFQPRPQDDPHLRRPDLTRARVLLQWSAKIPLEVGLQRTIEYFRARIPQVK
jgi:nucleoside-diphosphate-sugar epimerase